MPSMLKWFRDIRRECDAEGVSVTIANGGKHLKIMLPNGRHVVAPATPGDRRTLFNIRADVRRESAK